MTERGATRALAVASGLLFTVLWLGTGQHLAPSGDAATTWAAREPHRTVLCVTEEELVVAADPSAADRAAVSVPLRSTEVRQGGPGFGVLHRDHTYRASLRWGAAELPWMKNEYTAGFPEWLPHLATGVAGPAAGRASIFALGLLVLVGTALLAGRLGGPAGAAAAGGFLATDLWFHAWKKVLAGPEVWLQILALASAWALVRAVERRSLRWVALAGLLLGLGCHVKPSFAAVGFVLVACTLPWLRRWGTRRLTRGLALLLLGATLGGSPSLIYWAARPDSGVSLGRQETVTGRATEVWQRLTRRPELDRKGRGGKGISAVGAVLDPLSWWTRLWDGRAASDNDPAALLPSEPHRPSSLARAGQGALVVLLAVALLGGGLAGRRGGLAGWAVLLALTSPAAVRAVHADPHHLAMALPLLALGLGAGLGPQLRGRWLPLLAVIGLVALLGRSSELVQVDGELQARAGRLLDRPVLEDVARRLEARGAVAPAVIEYELMALLEASTDSRVRPFLYARAVGDGKRCLRRGRPAWLRAVLRAHRGGHLLLAWGPARSPLAGGASSWVDPRDLRDAATLEGLEVRAVEELEDARGRWVMTLWSVAEAP